MLAPFEGKGPLGARVGSLEDSSSRKFKDILLTEFFGTKTTHETKSSKPVGNSRKVIAMDTTGIPNVLPPKKLEVDEKVSLEDAGNGNVGAGGEAGENQRGESVLEPTDATFAFLVGALLTAVLISSVVHTS